MTLAPDLTYTMPPLGVVARTQIASSTGFSAIVLTKETTLSDAVRYPFPPVSDSRYAPESSAAVRAEFQALADWWHASTDWLSSPSARQAHPAYRRVIEMGEAAVPLILVDMHGRGGYWYAALREITGANPVKPDHKGRVDLMDEDWYEWAKSRD